MKEKGKMRKILRILLAVCAIGAIVFLVINNSPKGAKTDFGSYAGDSDYGGGSWDSGGSSWDSGGSSWDSGSYSWSSSDYGSYSRRNSRSVSSAENLIAAIILIFSIIMTIADISSKAGKTGGSHSTYTPERHEERQPEGGHFDLDGKSMASYSDVDPGFNTTALETYCSNLYVRMQECWTNRNIDELEPYFTNAFFTQMRRQLYSLKASHLTNYVERISVLEVTPLNWYSGGGYDHIRVKIRARIVDYTVDDDTGRITNGSKTAEKFMTYQWSICRKQGTVTEDHQKMSVVKCPHCGAEVEVNTSAVCPYCRSIVTAQPEIWAIENIKGISQETRY